MTTVPVTFRVAPLPSDFVGTPQDFAEAMVARMSIESPTAISFFVSGPTAPTSNVGPWLKNGITWYVWDTATASYIPQVVENASLKYVFQIAEPDHNAYIFWGKLDGSGKAQSIEYYFNGAWHDVYEDTFALYTKTTDMNTAIDTKIAAALVPYSTTTQMNTAITAAIAEIPSGKGTFQVYMAVPQTQPVAVSGVIDVVPVFGGVAADPDSCFSSNKYTCPANGYYFFNVIIQSESDDANITDLGIITGIYKNAGIALAGTVLQSAPNIEAAVANCVTVGPVLLNLGDQVYVSLACTVTTSAPSSFTLGSGGAAGAQFSGYMIRSA